MLSSDLCIGYQKILRFLQGMRVNVVKAVQVLGLGPEVLVERTGSLAVRLLLALRLHLRRTCRSPQKEPEDPVNPRIWSGWLAPECGAPSRPREASVHL